MRKTKLAMLQSVVALILCAAMLVGTTFAWFTDEVTSAVNKIQAGTLDVDLVDAAGNSLEGTSLTFMDVTGNTDILWEPGCTFKTQGFRVANRGSLALEYTMYINGLLGDSKLLEVIRFSVQDADGYTVDIDTFEGQLSARASSDVFYLVGHMDENAGNEYMNLTLTGIGITVYATQAMEENDSFGPEYDKDAFFPGLDAPILGSVNITTENDLLTADAYIDVEGAKVTIPAGTRVKPGTTTLKLRVKLMDETTSDVKLSDNQVLQPMDVTVEGISEDNHQPLTVELSEIAPVGLNMGSIALHHVHDGTTVTMTRVAADAAFTADNQYRYDPATGDLALHMATFSEVAVVADTENAWKGNFDYTWYTNAVAVVDDEAVADYVIANADQLAALGAIVGGMDGQTQDSFAGKTVKLIADINLGDKESENNPNIIFYPIGYYNSEGTYERTNTAITSGLRNFEGTFDGNGHTVSNFYQNTWEMKGDHDWYSPEEQYYRDGMGLFGRVYGGTVKNLTIKNFSSDGEITTTGCVAAYADGATFENIAIFDCNPRVYNIGNGGIVGCVGWYAKEANLKTTFTNITVDNSNKISALWGTYDVACGGIVGQYYPTSGQSSVNYPKNAGVEFTNCHVSAVMDVYNDVCANYQYYAYRYTGMLIGSVRENETIDGHVYPKMDGITAEDCTVHFGDWNDYYYCELVANSLASYTHDHQMSRLEQVASVDVANKKVVTLKGETVAIPTSGRVNYVVVKAKDANGMWIHGDGHDYAECYHFVNGVQHFHDVADADNPNPTETVNGVAGVLKEDKQLIYREFNNLVTGYGWGVTSKGVDDLAGVEILDRLEGNSVEKFEGKVTELANNKEYKLGDIFKFKDNGVEVIPGALTVTVTNLAENNPVSATVVYDRTNWVNGTITLTGTGTVKITIQDYYFCTPTTITVNVTERQSAEKFVTKFTGDFLYRVGNANGSPVKLGTMFKAAEGATIGTVSVTIENVAGNASGTYTSNATWTNGTIKFNGTGVVKVTIKDDDNYCTPTVLYLEVVDAKNVTGAENATANNVVLLNDIDASSLSIKDGFAFYGNGFKVKFNGDGSYRNAAVSYGFVTIENGGILDNAQVICKIFPQAYMFANEMTAGSDGRYPYGYSAVVISGNSTISNCYIYGARNNIQIADGNVTIQNTVTECGSLSNIHMLSASGNNIVLDNVTTIQRPVTDDFNVGNTMLGFGILVGTNETTEYPTIKITGDLRQYNWVSSDDAGKVSNTYCKTAITQALKVTDYQHTLDGKTMINLGIVFLTTNKTDIAQNDARSNKNEIPYTLGNVSMSGYTGQVYSVAKGSGITAASRYNAETDGMIPYNPSTNRVIAPKVTHSGANGSSLTINTAYNKAWVTTFTADLDKISGGSYSFTFNDLVINKYGKELTYKVKDSSGNEVDKSTVITLNQLFTHEYTLIVTDNAIYNRNGQLSDETVTHEMPFVLYATKKSIDPPQFNGIGAGVEGAIRLVESTGGNWRPAYPALEGVTVTYWSASENKTKTVDLSTLNDKGTTSGQTWTYTCDDFTLKITGGPVHTNTSYVISPMIATRDGKDILYFAAKNKDNTTGTTARLICLEYVFTDKNASTTVGQCTSYSNGIATVNYADLPEFSWSSFQKGKVEAVSSGGGGGCVTGDTLVTLADGTQKRIDSLTGAETLLVWDFYKGTYTVVPAALVINHGTDYWNVIQMEFEDGTVVNAVSAHAFFDADLNEFVMITPENTQEYVGHSFVKATENGYTTVKLVKCTASVQYTSSYSLVSAHHYNFIVEDMFSMTNLVPDLIAGLEIGENMKYDEATLAADIAQYGLYTYDDFADYITEAQFNAFNGAYLKISVGKGYITYEEIVELIISFVNN